MAIGFNKNSGTISAGESDGVPTTVDEVVVTARPRGHWYDPFVDAARHVAEPVARFLAPRPTGDHYYGLSGGGFRGGGGVESPADLSRRQEAFAAQAREVSPRLPLGKINNLPNTMLGVGYGLVGHAVGKMGGGNPRITVRDNAIQFIENPFGGEGAITLGNTTTYAHDPYNRGDRFWWNEDGTPHTSDKNPVYRHEEAHTRQGEILGGLYLPSNIAGGLWAAVHGKKWHDPLNWNEVGPQMNPPQPWPGGR
jgi:hypothetical protein